MVVDDRSLDLPAALRERALSLLAAREALERSAATASPTPDPPDATLHELRVHQIELELQNEELRRVQGELEASRQRWFDLYDLAPVGYCTVSPAGQMLQTNLAAAELLGLSRVALAGRSFPDFLVPADRPAYYAVLARLKASGERQRCELRVVGAQQAERWTQLSITVAARDGEGACSLRIVLVDVTAQRQAEATAAALRVSEQASRLRNEFLSRVGHEFRTPLNAILGFSHLLLQDRVTPPTPPARRYLQHIHDAGEHLLHMVTDLLDVAHSASGRLSLHLTTVDLLGVLRDALQDVAPQALQAGVALALEADGPAVAGVRADPTRLRQVVQNLLTNAVKYNRPGGRVLAQVTRVGRSWRLLVADNGLGMSAEQQAALFQPFNRLGRESAGIEGTGLGLVIARDLVRAMGGRLELHSTVGAGTECRVDLEAVPAAPRATAAEADEARDAPAVRTAARVLCAVADEAQADWIERLRERRPELLVESVASAADCVAAAQRAWPDLLLIEPRLSDRSALEVLASLLGASPVRMLPCVLLAPDDAPRPSDAGGSGRPKPVDVERLLPWVDGLVVAFEARGGVSTDPS